MSGTQGVVTRDNGANTNKAPRADEESGCGAAAIATEGGGVGTTAACNATVVC